MEKFWKYLLREKSIVENMLVILTGSDYIAFAKLEAKKELLDEIIHHFELFVKDDLDGQID